MIKPEIIGILLTATVLIDKASRSVMLAHDDFGTIKFSIDHPYIQGTKLERDARKAIDHGQPHD